MLIFVLYSASLCFIMFPLGICYNAVSSIKIVSYHSRLKNVKKKHFLTMINLKLMITPRLTLTIKNVFLLQE